MAEEPRNEEERRDEERTVGGAVENVGFPLSCVRIRMQLQLLHETRISTNSCRFQQVGTSPKVGARTRGPTADNKKPSAFYMGENSPDNAHNNVSRNYVHGMRHS